MMISKRNLIEYIQLIFFIITSGIYLLVANSIGHNISALLFLAFGAAFIVKFNITHPYVWYSGFFTLYATGYPILLYLENTTVDYGYTKELMVLHWVGLSTFLIVVGPKSVDIRSIKDKIKNFDCKSSKYIYVILSILTLALVFVLKFGGYGSKGEISQSLITSIGMRMILVYILITSIELIKGIYKQQKFNYKILFTTLILVFYIFYYSAERDLVLRYLMILFYLYYIFFYDKRHKIKLILIISSLISLVPFSRSIKHLGMHNEFTSLGSNFIGEFIKSEFHTQARNVQVLLNSSSYNSFFKGKTFLTSITNFFGISDFSSIAWFNDTFFPNRNSGMGFSLVGEGYVNFGYFGIIAMFIIIGLIIKLSYRNSSKSVYSLVVYLMIIPISIYTIRADLYNFLSQYLKQVLLIVILVKTLDKIIFNRYEFKLIGTKTVIKH